jgi:hypothetical protein
VVHRTGWHHHTFVLPHKAVDGASGELYIWDGDESHQDAFRAKGSLQEWQSQVGVELLSHYFQAELSRQFDAWIWFEETQAVSARPDAHPHGPDETYPFGL